LFNFYKDRRSKVILWLKFLQILDPTKNGVIVIFDAYFYDKNGQRVKTNKLWAKICVAKLSAYAGFIGLPTAMFLLIGSLAHHIEDTAITDQSYIIFGSIVWSLKYFSIYD